MLKTAALSLVLTTSFIAMPVAAQDIDIQTELAVIQTVCASNAAQCVTAVEQLVAGITDTYGATNPEQVNTLIGAVVTMLASMASVTPNPALAAAIGTAASGFTGPDAPTRVAAAQRIAEAVQFGSPVNPDIIGQLSSPN